jgi:transketolase
VYLRFGKAPQYDLHRAELSARRGQSILLRQGSDIALVATGEAVVHAVLAAEELATRDGVSCTVMSVPSIRPLDTGAIVAAAGCGALITIEEHMVHGGLGEACAAVLLEAAVRVRFQRIGIPDEYTVTGSQADIFRHYGISMEGISAVARVLLGRATARSSVA